MTFKPYSINNFFSDELFEKVKKEVLSKNMVPGGSHFYHTTVGRWLTEINFDSEIESQILSRARDIFNDDTLIRAGFHAARYQKQNEITPQLWKHYDQSACQYSIDLCIDKNIDWSIFVDGIEFKEEPNSCVIFSGNDNMHWRPKYPTENEDAYVTLLFMQFAKPDHWFFSNDRKEFSRHSLESDFRFREMMGYWSLPDYCDDRPICKCCDYRTVLDNEQDFIENRWPIKR